MTPGRATDVTGAHTTTGLCIAEAIHRWRRPPSAGMDTTPRVDVEPDAIRYLATAAAVGELHPGSLLVALTDDEARVEVAVAVDDVPVDPPQHSRVRALGPLLRHLESAFGFGGALLAVARHGDPRTQGGDLAWHDAFAGTTRMAGLACHGTYVVTPTGIRRVKPGPFRIAA